MNMASSAFNDSFGCGVHSSASLIARASRLVYTRQMDSTLDNAALEYRYGSWHELDVARKRVSRCRHICRPLNGSSVKEDGSVRYRLEHWRIKTGTHLSK